MNAEYEVATQQILMQNLLIIMVGTKVKRWVSSTYTLLTHDYGDKVNSCNISLLGHIPKISLVEVVQLQKH
jgi:hypothetical protein